MATASNKKTVDPKPFPCAECGASFEFKQSLKKHEACNHGGGEYTHTCEVCFMAFKNPSTLKVRNIFFTHLNSPSNIFLKFQSWKITVFIGNVELKLKKSMKYMAHKIFFTVLGPRENPHWWEALHLRDLRQEFSAETSPGGTRSDPLWPHQASREWAEKEAWNAEDHQDILSSKPQRIQALLRRR